MARVQSALGRSSQSPNSATPAPATTARFETAITLPYLLRASKPRSVIANLLQWQTGQTHAPATHWLPEEQTLPQAPQLSALFTRSVQ